MKPLGLALVLALSAGCSETAMTGPSPSDPCSPYDAEVARLIRQRGLRPPTVTELESIPRKVYLVDSVRGIDWEPYPNKWCKK
jgi:hypothetical protein